MIISKRKMQCVALHDLDSTGKFFLLNFVSGRLNHFVNKVQTGHGNVGVPFGRGDRKITCSAGNIQVAVGLKKLHFFCGKIAPGHITPQA